ncbi:hypothetical protein OSB04_un000843 [Centaurea solstitialis]|uniref:CCHC-type domain-containing protein n=1 Tax=Centaurea solstitialis TaxID=347529 RepID=A0AA38SMU7_9ASTR|nr:hypothetical protein OSB04_un000843 [Centaurea solstitialis]
MTTSPVHPSILSICVAFLSVFGNVVTGQFTRFNNLTLPQGVTGPESAAFRGLGVEGPFTTVTDGRILKWQGPNIGFVDFAYTSPARTKQFCDGITDPAKGPICGRPLALSYQRTTGLLYIADAYLGLLVVGPNGGLATQLAGGFKFLTGVDVDLLTGLVYLSDASLTYEIRNTTQPGFQPDSTGRFLRYNPLTRRVSVLLSGLSGGGGPAVSADSTFVLVSELNGMRVLKYWLAGARANTAQRLLNIDGNPNKIKRAERLGEFWVAVSIGEHPRRATITPQGLLINSNGVVLKTVLFDREFFNRTISLVQEQSGRLYVCSRSARFGRFGHILEVVFACLARLPIRNFHFPNWILVSRFGTLEFLNRNSSAFPNRIICFPSWIFFRSIEKRHLLKADPSCENTISKEIISIGSETRPPVLVVGKYQQWKRRMINFLDLLDDKLMVSITEGPIRPTVTVAEVARTEVTPYLPAYEVEKPYDMFSHEQRARAAIDKRALTLLTMALPNDMFARVDSCKDARSMWLGIEQQMQGGDKALEGQKENAMNAYESFCAREGETLTDTYNHLNICVNDLRRLGLEKNKYEVNVKFLKWLNKLWQSVTISIQVSQNLGQLGLHDLYSMMLPHEETLFGKTEKKIDPPTLALMANRGSSSHDNYTVEEPVVLDDGLTEEEMYQLENSFALMAKFRGNPQRFNRFRQGPQFVGGQSSQGGYQSRENFQRNDQGRSNNYQQRETTSNSKGIRITTPTTTMETEDIREVVTINGRWYNNTGGTEPPQQNKLPALEAPPAANQNRNPARGPTCYNCGTLGHYAFECKIKLKDSAYFEKKAAIMKKKELGKVLMADEEDWVMEPEDSDDEGLSAVQGHCLMADFEEPCISGSPNDSTEEEAEVTSCSYLSKPVELSGSETLRLESQLQMERALVARFRIESVVYKSSLEDLTENFNKMELECGIRESILENKLLDLQRSHDEIESSREESF